MQRMVGDIGNAYLEVKTKEKVYFIAGPKFDTIQGHTLIIIKALYDLRTSGAHFHDKLATTLMEDGWKPSLANLNLWYQDAGDCYKYLCMYMLMICF